LVARDWADAQLGLALTFGSDLAVTDAARLFFGNVDAVFYRIGKTMPTSVVADLIVRGRDAREARSPKNGQLLPVNSSRRLAGPELVKLATGETVRVDEITPGQTVHCPHHNDGDPSAFVVASQSRRGSVGIHCMACRDLYILHHGFHDGSCVVGISRSLWP
jgi:hypothetical protein